MPWIKKNLVFVISGAIGLILTGLAGFFLYSEMQDDQAGAAALAEKSDAYKRVAQSEISPTDANIELAKADSLKAEALITKAKSQFTPFKKYAPASDREYKDYLEKNVGDMQRAAAAAGVGLSDPDYYFSFGCQKDWLKINVDLTPQWIEQMEEVKTLVGILVKAHVNTIEALRRVRLDITNEVTGYDCFNGLTAVTNKGVIRTPYEVTFRSFTAELAGVLDGFMHASNCFLIKNIYITPSGAQSESFLGPNDNPNQTVIQPIEAKPVVAAPAAVSSDQSGVRSAAQLQDDMAKRYHLGKYARQSTAVQNTVIAAPSVEAAKPGANQVQAPPVRVLGETPIRATIFLEILKLDPASGN